MTTKQNLKLFDHYSQLRGYTMIGCVEEYIEKELHWLTDSFDTVSVLWIADNYESNVQMEDE